VHQDAESSDHEVPHQTETAAVTDAPHPGSALMPRWSVGELSTPPVWTGRSLAAMLGPGLMMAGAAIGGGEWLLGPRVGAQYGGALLWVATVSLLCQFVYNIEASRYALYTGESIMTGKFRTRPGPLVWLALYLLVDLGALLPYQVASVATPVAAVYLGRIPDPEIPAHVLLLRYLTYAMLVVSLLPLIFGGKVYNALKALMTVKFAVVFSFLLLLAFFYSSWTTWLEIGTGLFRFGTFPGPQGSTVNPVGQWIAGGPWPVIDKQALSVLTAFAAIAGVGGLAQTSISSYTRDQGWGMGAQVGAIPSLVGGRHLKLSHCGSVFRLNPESLERWRGWVAHVVRDQLIIWLPASVIGLVLPTMLSIEFLPRGTQANQWVMAGMTADGVAGRVGGGLGALCWYLVLLSGFLVLLPNAASNADGFIRRWIDVAWTGLPVLRRLNPHRIRHLYFALVVLYFAIGVVFLSVAQPLSLIILYGNLGNFALGLSCWHTLYVNLTLLPPELQPGWGSRIGLSIAGLYYLSMAFVTAAIAIGWI
jgi:hypothetical protein